MRRTPAGFAEQIGAYRRFGKPVAATEFGCCTYRGAADRGGTGWMVVDESADPPRITVDLERDEDEQVRYFHELTEVFEANGLDSAFWFAFGCFELTRRPDDPAHDLDTASYGLVAPLPAGTRATTYPDMAWEPKRAFHAVARAYARATDVPTAR